MMRKSITEKSKPRQIDYVHKLWRMGINIVSCNTCPSVFFHESKDTKLICPYCLTEGNAEDFSDLVHE